MDIGETIEFIRKTKNIKIKKLCGNKISRQTYFRLVNNQADTSVTNFIFILEQLNVNFEEFFFIKNNYNLSETYIAIANLRKYFEEKNIAGLTNLKNFYENSKDTSLVSFHLYHLVSIYLAHITQSSTSCSGNILKEYLINVETWTHYEMVLFNNVMFLFDVQLIELLANKAINNIQKYATLRKYGNEGFRMTLNVIICFIERKEAKKAIKTISLLMRFTLQEDDLYEKVALLFFSGLQKILLADDSGWKKCTEAIKILETLGASNTSNMFKFYLEQFK